MIFLNFQVNKPNLITAYLPVLHGIKVYDTKSTNVLTVEDMALFFEYYLLIGVDHFIVYFDVDLKIPEKVKLIKCFNFYFKKMKKNIG